MTKYDVGDIVNIIPSIGITSKEGVMGVITESEINPATSKSKLTIKTTDGENTFVFVESMEGGQHMMIPKEIDVAFLDSIFCYINIITKRVKPRVKKVKINE